MIFFPPIVFFSNGILQIYKSFTYGNYGTIRWKSLLWEEVSSLALFLMDGTWLVEGLSTFWPVLSPQ
jgi:hypothetical protein